MEEENSQRQPPQNENRRFFGFIRKQNRGPVPNLSPGSSGREQPQAFPDANAPSRPPESLYDKLSEKQKVEFDEESKDTEEMLRKVFSEELHREQGEDGSITVTYAANSNELVGRIMVETRNPDGEVLRRAFIYNDEDPNRFRRLTEAQETNNSPTT